MTADDDTRGGHAQKFRSSRRGFLIHGDEGAQQAPEPKVRALGIETHGPRWHERGELA